MQSREPVILVLDSDTERVLTRCVGPEPDGFCPHVTPGDAVACAGQVLRILTGEGADGMDVAVDGSEVVCPVPMALAS